MYRRSNPAWDAAFARVLKGYQIRSIDDFDKRLWALYFEAKERGGQRFLQNLASLTGRAERLHAIYSGADLTAEEYRTLYCPCRERGIAWESYLQRTEQLADPLSDIECHAYRHALLLPDVLKKGHEATDTDRIDIDQEAKNVLRIVLHGARLSPITWRGPRIGHLWFSIGPNWGEHRATQALRNYIDASSYDPDYWEAVMVIRNRLIEEGQPLPSRLSNWFQDVEEGRRKAPLKTRGGPPYANENRNSRIAYAESVLRYLGMTREDALWVITRVIRKDASRTRGHSKDDQYLSYDTIRTASRNLPFDELPAPWECWPSPQDYAELRRRPIGGADGLR